LFDEHALFVLVSYLERDPDVALAFPDYYLVDEGGEDYRARAQAEDIRIQPTPWICRPHGACTLIRKTVLEAIGGYREDLGAQDGFDVWTKIRNTASHHQRKSALFYYRRHGEKSDQQLASNPGCSSPDQEGCKLRRAAQVSSVAGGHTLPAELRFRPDLWSVELNGKVCYSENSRPAWPRHFSIRFVVASTPIASSLQSTRL
jgi:hypothetical protein